MIGGLRFGIRTFIFVLFLTTFGGVSTVHAESSTLVDYLYLSPTYAGGDHPNSDYPYKGVKVVPDHEYLFNSMTAAVYADNGSYPDSPPIQFCLYTLHEDNSLDSLVECSTNSFLWPELGVGGRNDVTFSFDDYVLASSTAYAFVYGSDTFDASADATHLGMMYRYPDFVPEDISCAWHPDKTALGCFTNQPAIFSIGYIDPEPEAGSSSILFLPGFLGTRLYTTGDRLLWEPNGSDDIRDLAMNASGASKLPVYVGEVVDKVAINGVPLLGSIYGNMLAWIKSLETSGVIEEGGSYPYDWRYDVFDVVDDGALKDDGSREYLVEKIEQMAADSYTGKVTLIGHSNGGLLAKALMIRLAEEGKTNLVDQIIFIGSPQVGTPEGMLGLLHGHKILPPFIALNGTVRVSAASMPGAYSLLPSAEYFSLISEPIATFENGTVSGGYKDLLGESIASLPAYISFLLNEPPTRTIPHVTDEETPLPLSGYLWQKSANSHAALDSWTPPAGVEVHEIAGWGNKTVTGARYYTETSYECPSGITSCGFHESLDFEPVTTRDGDNTVATKSALFQNSGVYFDLLKLSKLENGENENRKHENITESAKLHKYLESRLGLGTEYDGGLFTTHKPNESEEQIVVSVHSPAVISLRDNQDSETGIFPVSGSDLFYIKEEIPDSAVQFGGEGKYVYVPSASEYEVSITGTGQGTFTVRIAEEDGEVLKEYVDLPVNAQTKASLTVTENTVSPLLLDTDGDGAADITVEDTMTRRDALKLCREELKSVRSPLIRAYLLSILIQMDRPALSQGKFKGFFTIFKKYIDAKWRTIPASQRDAIATCLTVLENSKK